MTLGDKLYKILIYGGSWKTILGGLRVTVAIITFALNVSAHVAELLRSALLATDKGQAEAARTMQPLLTISIGMLIYLVFSCVVFGIFALSDKISEKKRRAAA